MITHQIAGPLFRAFRKFRRDQRGSITMQVIVFSILLLGTSGLVLDSGRLYGMHSQMQAYADHMALAAANELDGRDDAIARAADAVYNFTGSVPFIDGTAMDGGAFKVEQIVFYSEMGTPSGTPNDLRDSASWIVATASASGVSYTAGAAADSQLAQYAAVVVSEHEIGSVYKSVGSILTALTTGGATVDPEYDYSNGVRKGNVGFQTMAAATMARETCADLSTIVLCNPWETETAVDDEGNPVGQPFGSRALDKEDADYQNLPGRSLMTFAPNFDRAPYSGDEVAVADGTAHGSVFDWDVTNQVMRLTDPVADPGGVCGLTYLLDVNGNPVASEGAPDYLTFRDTCLMARARSETVCFDDTIKFKPAPGPMLSRATNTIFDRWAEPFRTIIQNDVTIPNTGLTRAQFFEPDSMVASPFESADRHGEVCPADTETGFSEQDGTYDYNQDSPPRCNHSDPFQAAYETVPLPGQTYLRLVYTLHVGKDFCHQNTLRNKMGDSSVAGCAYDYIGDYHDGVGGTIAAQQRAWMTHYWNRMYRSDSAAPPLQPTGANSWYQVYQVEKANQAILDPWDALSGISMYSTENAERLGIPTDEASRQQKFVKFNPAEYLAATGFTSVFSTAYERRRIRSAMVNCQAAVNSAAPGDADFEAPVEQIVDWYIPEAASIYCGPGLPECDLDGSVESRMFVELIDTADQAYMQRFTVHLVR